MEIKNLGWRNSWGKKEPAELELCRMKGHKKERKEIGRCRNEYSCKICGYSYKVDSSG